MNSFIAHFFEHIKNENSVNIPLVIDSIESLKTLTKSLLYFPQNTLKDQEEIAEQIDHHFQYVDQLLKNLDNGDFGIDSINKLVVESKEKGLALLKHYKAFDSKTLSEASSFYQLLMSGELVLEGVTNYAG